ncbi:hypothetical protein G4B88_011715 [Cannabis sativa]|uniref:DUF4283 domain-containing protein n=1 Tax=Cannabis sativa TaxID=3483 RepID=A0A7J6EY79_CANSA|nr:hypothetical protein G4B88_011715 [Cannabis sativa]
MHTRGVHGPSGYGKHQNPTGFGKKKGHYPTGPDWQNQCDPLIDQKLRKYWSFHTKYKVFMITLTYDGGSVRICERTRHFGYEITITIDAVDWLIETVKEVHQKEERQRVSFKRSFRNSSDSWLLECFSNRKGSFLKLSALRNNKLKSVIIPEEEIEEGWSELIHCLNRTMKREQASVYGKSVQKIGEMQSKGPLNQRSWVNVVKETGKPMVKQPDILRNATSKQPSRRKSDIEWLDLYPAINPSFKPKNPYPEKRFQQPKLYEYMRSKAQKRNWKLAIILTRDNSHVSWSVIFYNLSRELGRKLVVNQLFDDRCIVWCKDEKERDALILIQRLRVPGAQTVVSLSQWSWEAQKESIKVECRDSWIGIYGLPLSLWNMKTFRKIGECCGGLLDVDKESAEASLLSHVRLQLVGDENGFIPESLIMEYEDSKVELRLFKLNDLSYRFHGYFRTCWYQDFDHNKMAGDEVDTGADDGYVAEGRGVAEAVGRERVNGSRGERDGLFHEEAHQDEQSISVSVPHFAEWTIQPYELMEKMSNTFSQHRDKDIFCHGTGDSDSLSHENTPRKEKDQVKEYLGQTKKEIDCRQRALRRQTNREAGPLSRAQWLLGP